MDFFIYDLIFLAVFSAFLITFLIIKRKNLGREGIVFLYRTKLGLKIIKTLGEKYKRLLHWLEYVVIATGYALMAIMLYLLFRLVYVFSKFPELFKIVKVPPLMPLVPYLPRIFKADFLPPFYFTYWIIVLAIAAIPHEFFHGIFVKARNVKIKSTGFAFLGPFTGAFVEPDEKKASKLKIKEQLGFLSAGTFANVLMAILFFFVLWLFFSLAYSPSGVVFGSYASSVIATNNITNINNNLSIDLNGGLNLTEVKSNNKTFFIEKTILENAKENNVSQVIAFQNSPALKAGLAGIIVSFDGKEIKDNKDLESALNKKNPGDNVLIKTSLNDSIQEFNIQLAERPDNNKSYLGISPAKTSSFGGLKSLRDSLLFFRDPFTYYRPRIDGNLIIFIYNLLWWVILISFSVALVNMLPLGIFDGGRVFYLTILGLTKSKKIAKKAYNFSTYFLIFIFLLLMYLWVVNFF